MATDYEVEVEVAVAKIRDALLRDPTFLAELSKKLRTEGFKTGRANPGANGGNPRNPNAPTINPKTTP